MLAPPDDGGFLMVPTGQKDAVPIKYDKFTVFTLDGAPANGGALKAGLSATVGSRMSGNYRLATTVAMHGRSTMMTAVRMSATTAISGVASVGKPSPSAPCTTPARSTTATIHVTRGGVRDSKPGIDTRVS